MTELEEQSPSLNSLDADKPGYSCYKASLPVRRTPGTMSTSGIRKPIQDWNKVTSVESE